jgi:hypothetical protein
MRKHTFSLIFILKSIIWSKFIIFAIWLLFANAAVADTQENKVVQKYLNDLGYNVGAVDGIIGRNSKKQISSALRDHGFTYAGYTDEVIFILAEILERKKNEALPETKVGITRKNLEKIMDKETAKLFFPSTRNTKRVDAFELVDFEGRIAAKISISMLDKGHPDDWGRFGIDGHAQRVAVMEKPRLLEMKDGGKYWYKFSIFIPESVGSDNHSILLFDLKDRKNGSQRGPALAFTVTNNQVTFQLKTIGEECQEVTNSQGDVSEFCERPGLVANMSNLFFKDQWLDFVFEIDLRKEKEITRFWVNRKLVGVANGDLSPEGQFLGFKFGAYRNSIKKPPKDEIVYFSDIMRRNSCEELGVIGCDSFINSQRKNGFFGASEILYCGKRSPCPVVCRGKECEVL